MTEHDDKAMDLLQQQLAILDLALRPNGTLGEIALGVVTNGHELEPHEAADVLLPPRQTDSVYQARWQLIEGAPEAIKAATSDRAKKVFELAAQIGMRKSETLPQTELGRIDSEKAIWLVEGGANRTSVVRRELILQAMYSLYGDKIEDKVVYQFGSSRPISREVTRDGQVIPNAEYGVAQEIGGDYLPKDDSLTEFKLNLAAAQQAGYVVAETEDETPVGVEQVVVLHKDGRPTIKLVQPEKDQGGLVDGFTAASKLEGDVEGRQFVIGTNGQYRPKDELQAQLWATRNQEMLPAVAIGDEPGFMVEHNGRQIQTAERAPTAYINEMVILHRLNK